MGVGKLLWIPSIAAEIAGNQAAELCVPPKKYGSGFPRTWLVVSGSRTSGKKTSSSPHPLPTSRDRSATLPCRGRDRVRRKWTRLVQQKVPAKKKRWLIGESERHGLRKRGKSEGELRNEISPQLLGRANKPFRFRRLFTEKFVCLCLPRRKRESGVSLFRSRPVPPSEKRSAFPQCTANCGRD